jgi:hypothetical protein
LRRVCFGLIESGRGWFLIDCREQKRKAQRRAVEKRAGERRPREERVAFDVWKSSKRIPLHYSMSNRWWLNSGASNAQFSLSLNLERQIPVIFGF